MIPNKRDICDNLDADGLRDFILDHGIVKEFNEPHQLHEDYHLLLDDAIDDIDDEVKHSITKLYLPKFYGAIHDLKYLNFSDYEFDQLEILVLGINCMETIRSLCFTGNNITICFDYS